MLGVSLETAGMKYVVWCQLLNPFSDVFTGQNCLHLASVQGFLSLVENMVDLGADINAKVYDARTK